jgi:predicted N-acyltransferase
MPPPTKDQKPSLSFSWHTRVDEIKAEWNDCFYNHQAMRSHELQRALEAAELPNTNFHHLHVTDERGAAMMIPCCTVKLCIASVGAPWIRKMAEGVRKIFPEFLFTRLFVVGSAMSTCGDNIGIRDMNDESRWPKERARAIFDEVIKKAKSLGISFVVIKEPDEKTTGFLRARLGNKFFFAESLPTTYLTVGKPGDYLRSMRTKYRNKFKKRRAVAAERGLYWVTEKTIPASLLDRVYDLHCQIMDHAEVVFERLNRKFFDKAQEFIEKDPAKNAFYTLGFQKLPNGGRKLICCEFVQTEGDTLFPLYTGFDYEIKKESDLYFNAFYALIDEAEKRGFKRIHFGQTAYEVKAEIGCTGEPLFIGVHYRNPIVHAFLSLLRGVFFETVKYPIRDVFVTPPENKKSTSARS